MPNPTNRNPLEAQNPKPNPEQRLGREYLSEVLESIDSAALLIGTLERYVAPTRRAYELEFLSQEPGIYNYPEAIKYRLLDRNLQRIVVSITQEDSEPSTTTVEFHDEDGVVHLSRDSVRSNDTFDMVIDDKSEPRTIAKVPNYEINALLLSIIGQPTEAQYSNLLQDKHEMVVGENMIGALQENAAEITTYSEYKLDRDNSIFFTKANNTGEEKLTGFRIVYIDARQRKIAIEVDQKTGFTVKFKLISGTETSDFYPDKNDYVSLIEVVKAETEHILSGLEHTTLPIDEVLGALATNLADPNTPKS